MRTALLTALTAYTLLVPRVAAAQPARPRGGGEALAATGSAPAAPPAPQPARAPIESQQVSVPDSRVQAGRVSTVIEAPFAVVAGVVSDLARYREFLPRVRQSRVVRRRRGQADVYLEVPLLENLGLLWANVRFDVRRTPASLVVAGRMINGNLTRFDCHVQAEPVPGTTRTRVTMQVLGIPALPFPIPAALLASQQGRWAARSLAAMRDRAELLAAARATGGGPVLAPRL